MGITVDGSPVGETRPLPALEGSAALTCFKKRVKHLQLTRERWGNCWCYQVLFQSNLQHTFSNCTHRNLLIISQKTTLPRRKLVKLKIEAII